MCFIGLAVREEVLLHRPGLRVIFMSGYADTAVVHDGDSMPRAAFLLKPFSSEMLLHKIREVLDAP
jgi:FixJ family two-component response regulator